MVRKRFVSERSVSSAADPSGVIDRIRRPATWPEWQSEIVSTEGPERLGDGDVVSGRAEMLGFAVDGQSVTVEADEQHYVEDVVVGVGMRVSYTVTPSPTGSTITHRLECLLPGGPMGGILSFFLRRRFLKMQRELLGKLSQPAAARADGAPASD
jgi:hypothetical protein